ncbi:unnamed protein product [Rotaria magnacalcarata]|uniref:Secreted protein n=1 Tax=Rotaria magnacalcarata TaxID=392030 RepID=A0A816PQU8_9BILA|nr:unnamed protein product [Rotaria magnacalcarata]CAF1682441.1 unnamed protein product [Rotaria magnacalcarata]CAF2050616.1 unnamed protein product [Rotaria magnacalcarata]CAF4009458.1 unnamed protein product [Rotaria magnacalcarata]CAF4122856.1 unnamed protein product [Rotaria magnacalcarata]
MFYSSLISISFLAVVLFNEVQWVDTSGNGKSPDDLTEDPNLGVLPPRPGEAGSQVPPNWQWKRVLVDDLSSHNPEIKTRAERLFQENTIYSILSNEENRARNDYESKEQEHIRNKQIQYNENMKNEWKKNRMDSLPNKCILSRR